MATYFSNSTNQVDISTLYSRESGNALYPAPSIIGNMLYVNHPPSGLYSEFPGIIQSEQSCIEPPAGSSGISQDSSSGEPELIASHLGQRPYGAPNDARNEMFFMQMIGGAENAAGDVIQNDPHTGVQLQFGILNGQDVLAVQGRGLSLSLNTQNLLPSFQYWPAKPDISTLSSYNSSNLDEDVRLKHMQTVQNSIYLKATQALLDEVVNVWKATKHKETRSQSLNDSAGKTGCKDIDGVSKGEGMPLNAQETNTHATNELSPSEKQELQNKMAKLLTMLDEVDKKYKHYYHQMQVIVSSFDVVAGVGSAMPYTAVALQTISRHFRCLRDAINDQIRSVQKKLGEEDGSAGKGCRLTRLRYIDQQLRQQRAFQQFGMMHQNAWRPQRGLPENSVSILRAWLFEHFLHPYPSDSEKLMLARQTGLTRSQIANWFINARVRLWKPMIEDMYKEELGDMEVDSNSSSDNAQKIKDNSVPLEGREDLKGSTTDGSRTNQLEESKPNNGRDACATTICFQNEANGDNTFMNLMLKDPRSSERDGGLLFDAVAQKTDSPPRFMAYQMMTEIGRYTNSSVSLTLGLQHPDGGDLSILNSQQGFTETNDCDPMNPIPLLRDFVA